MLFWVAYSSNEGQRLRNYVIDCSAGEMVWLRRSCYAVTISIVCCCRSSEKSRWHLLAGGLVRLCSTLPIDIRSAGTVERQCVLIEWS